jgi:processive 1,2-diacylglycerol beta-glucosyltransferase
MKQTGLIFTAATGGGHNQAALSLKQQMAQEGFDMHVIDVFKENGKFLELLIEDGYSVVANRVPYLYGGIYKFSGQRTPNKHLRRFFKVLLKRQLMHYLSVYEPSILVSTHPIFVHLIAELKREGYTTAACLSVITDLGVHRFYLHPDIDAYITGLESTKKQLIQFGISPEKIYIYGIPVKSEFYNSVPLPAYEKKNFTLLVMGGSMGSRKLYSTLAALMRVEKPIDIHVVCGNNAHVRERIQSHFANVPEHIHLYTYGFIDNVHELMDHADLLISKPGGLTLTEAIHKNLPLIMPFFIHGQEEENAQILAEEGLGIQVENIKTLDKTITHYIDHPEALHAIAEKMHTVSSQYSLEKIAQLCFMLTKREFAS